MTFWRAARDLAAFLLLIVAVLGAIGLLLPEMAGAATAGVVVGAVTVLLRGSLRDAVLAAFAQACLSGVAFVLTGSPWVAGVLMAGMGVAMALAGRIGWRSVVMILSLFTASALFPVHVPGDAPPGSIVGAVGIALAVLLGGLLGGVVLRWAVPHHRPTARPPVAWEDVAVNAVALGVTLGIGTVAVLTWDRTPVASWLMVTIVVLATPTDDVTMRRSAERLAGVLAGCLIAAVLALVLDAEWQSGLIALALFVAAWSFRLSHPAVEKGHGYWVYALVSTPAMVLLAVPAGGHATLAAVGQRAVLTIGAVVAVVLLTQVARWVAIRWATARGGEESPA